MQKEKQKISTILLFFFSVLILLLGAAIYLLPNYYFININTAFDPADSRTLIVASKEKKLRSPDFSAINSDKFDALEKGYWYTFDENYFELGNNNPFEKNTAINEKKRSIR